MKKTDNRVYFQDIVNELSESTGIKTRKVYQEKDSYVKGYNAALIPPEGNIGVSKLLMNIAITEDLNKYIIKILGHELGHAMHQDNRTSKKRLGLVKPIETRPKTLEFQCIRVINTLTETRADLEGLRLAKKVFPKLFITEEDIKKAFIHSSNEKNLCYLIGYLVREDRTKAGLLYLEYDDIRSVLAIVYDDLLKCYGVTHEEMLTFLYKESKKAQWYYVWFKFLFSLKRG